MELKKLKMEERKLLQSGDEMENDFTIWSQYWDIKIKIGGFNFEIWGFIQKLEMSERKLLLSEDEMENEDLAIWSLVGWE